VPQTHVKRPFELLLFTTRLAYLPAVEDGAIAGLVVDWETTGKHERQRGRDTQIGADTLEDLVRVRAATRSRILCRVHGPGPGSAVELERAIGAGADEVLLPMVTTPQEVESVLDLVEGRCALGILVETEEAVRNAEALGELRLARAYVGLNDLAIDRGSDDLFAPLRDGTIDRLRAAFRCPFGFGGLTDPARGSPVPARVLIGEMARVGCEFGVLRRSFLRDVPPEKAAFIARAIADAYHALEVRPDAVARR
jgi:hypothetical protein